MSAQGEIRLVLGSGSPRRSQLLRQLRIEFEQMVSSRPEPHTTDEDPRVQAVRCAHVKAQAVREQLPPSSPPTIVIGADTMVVVDDRILGKPADAADAKAMLRLLSGRSHTVCTGVCLLGPHPRDERTDSVATEVWMKPLTASDIETYVASGEPMDKAGSYAIQGLGARFVERISGCYYNVVGLPLARLTAMLSEAGYS